MAAPKALSVVAAAAGGGADVPGSETPDCRRHVATASVGSLITDDWRLYASSPRPRARRWLETYAVETPCAASSKKLAAAPRAVEEPCRRSCALSRTTTRTRSRSVGAPNGPMSTSESEGRV